MTSIVTHQPFKGLYALFAIGLELTRLPFWILKYLTPYGRQHPTWSFRQALGTRCLYAFLQHASMMQLRQPLPLTPGAEKDRFTTIPPAPETLYRGPLLHPAVKPATIGATWYPAPLATDSDTSAVVVVLHLHGGAFVTGDGRTASTGYLARQLLAHTPTTHVLAPAYRLSTLPPSTSTSATSNPFPAALQDALSAYLHLLRTLRVPAAQVVVS
ncbi:hypothetical protein AOQ84DRAFT_209908, partial [Glonium stellatum]